MSETFVGLFFFFLSFFSSFFFILVKILSQSELGMPSRDSKIYTPGFLFVCLFLIVVRCFLFLLWVFYFVWGLLWGFVLLLCFVGIFAVLFYFIIIIIYFFFLFFFFLGVDLRLVICA